MIATTICLVAGVSPRVIKDVVSHFKGVEHRIEFVRDIMVLEFIMILKQQIQMQVLLL